MHSLHHRRYLLFGLDAGRVKAVRARFRIGLQAIDHHGEVGLPDQKAFTTAGQQHAAVVGVDGGPRRLDAFDPERTVV
jgi:hypothetical protein